MLSQPEAIAVSLKKSTLKSITLGLKKKSKKNKTLKRIKKNLIPMYMLTNITLASI